MSDLFNQAKMEELLTKLCDERMSEAEFRELDGMLMADVEARRFYREYLNMHASLHTYLEAERQQSTAKTLRFPPLKLRPIRPQPRPKVSAIGLAAAAVLILGLGLGFLNWALQWELGVGGGSLVAEESGKMEETEDLAWEEGSDVPEDGLVMTGQRFHLASGMAALELNRGVRVAIGRGSDVEVLSDNSMRLYGGRLMAQVPEGAEGFTVYAPNCEVVDLGTAFAMEVRASGAVDVSVFEGIVEVAVMDEATGEMVAIQPVTVGQTRRLWEGELPEKVPFRGRKRFGDLREMQDGTVSTQSGDEVVVVEAE
ncbi:MAG: FecR domain-containing protein [Verrucomicrobiota bacterium]